MRRIAHMPRRQRGTALMVLPKPQSLPREHQIFFEGRLGQDFSRVRIHTDESAAAMAAALGAKAFTVGKDIVFAAGRYQPEIPEGRERLAHELVHVAQQSHGGSGTSQAESRAAAAARRLMRGEAVPPQDQGGAAHGLYCDSDDKKKLVDTGPAARIATTSQAPPTAVSGTPWLRMPSLIGPPGLALTSLKQPTLPLSPLAMPGPVPSLPPFKLMANADILAPFSAYGTSPSAAGFDIRNDWAMAFSTFKNYMPEGLAASSATTFLSAAYQSTLGAEQPSIFDKANLNTKAAHPDELRIPPIPVVSSSTLTTLYEWITKRKNTNAAYF